MDGSRILVVEDEPILREFLTLIVEDTGATVSAVETADEGIALLDRKPWAAVITDVRTPGQADGWDLAWAAHDRWPDSVVVVTSGGNDMFDRPLPEGAVFIEKPWAAEQLISALLKGFNAQDAHSLVKKQ
ncbi:response regulator [Pseudomonas putida]|uniref:response regulator n=1 Tax=Pseudomonas putida TaxID=303 RepID=UPI0018AA85E1|nr:response regulator [Pseudomonas putida]MBF8660881.1 response regulator [Pseudomonas putida]